MLSKENALYFFHHPCAKRFVMQLNKYFWNTNLSKEENCARWLEYITKTGNHEREFLEILNEPHVLKTDYGDVNLDEGIEYGLSDDVQYIEDNNIVNELRYYAKHINQNMDACLIYVTPNGLSHAVLGSPIGKKVVYKKFVGVVVDDVYCKSETAIYGVLSKTKNDVFIKM